MDAGIELADLRARVVQAADTVQVPSPAYLEDLSDLGAGGSDPGTGEITRPAGITRPPVSVTRPSGGGFDLTDFEAGLEWSREALRLRATAFRADLRNEIFFDPVTGGSRNRQPTRRQGFTLEGTWQAAPSLEVYANYVHADATFRAEGW